MRITQNLAKRSHEHLLKNKKNVSKSDIMDKYYLEYSIYYIYLQNESIIFICYIIVIVAWFSSTKKEI